MAGSTVGNPYEQMLERFFEAAAEGNIKNLQVMIKGKIKVSKD